MTHFTNKFVVFFAVFQDERVMLGHLLPPSWRDRLHRARNQPVRLRFGPFEIDRVAGRLYKRGVPLHIESLPFLVLEALLERLDDIVTREELQQRIWGDSTNVGFEDGLNTAVRNLRVALGDSSDSPLFIETIPKRGYRFVAPLSEGKSGGNDDSPARADDSVQKRPDEAIQYVEDPSQDLSQTHTRSGPWIANLNRRELVAAGVVLILVPIAAIAGLMSWRHERSQRLASSFSALQARRLNGV